MNATETELKAMSGRFTADTEPDAESVQGWTCSLCGLPCAPSQSPYAHNTCSQLCAITAAIVEAINGWRLDSFPPNDVCNMQSHWAGPLTADDCTQHE